MNNLRKAVALVESDLSSLRRHWEELHARSVAVVALNERNPARSDREKKFHAKDQEDLDTCVWKLSQISKGVAISTRFERN